MALLSCALCTLPVRAQMATTPGSVLPQPQTKTALRLKTPEAVVRLYGADCKILCSLSALFAPAVERDRVAAVPVTNLSTQGGAIVSVRFVSTNPLAMAYAPKLSLDSVPTETAPMSLLADPNATVSIASGETKQLRLALQSTRLPAGLYTGQLEFRAKPETDNADPITQVTTLEIRIRDSAIWALLTIVLGIVLGRVAQLVYDPQVIAKLQLLDWIHQLEAKIAQVQNNAVRAVLTTQLNTLRTQLFSRGADVAALQINFRALETAVNNTIGGPAIATIAPPAPQALGGGQGLGIGKRIGAGIGQALRILAGVTALPLQDVYDWLLPIFVVLTLTALSVVFVFQQYGGTGMAETFGAGGLADYAGLFLAGVASEAIAGGLRTVKLR